MPTVWGYCRVSDEQQMGRQAMLDGKVVDDTSLDNQKHILIQWWDRNKRHYPGHEFARDDQGNHWFYEDPAQSASKIPLAQRPQGRHMLARLSPGDIVLVVDTDRIFRDTEDTIATMRMFVKRGYHLKSVNQPNIDWSDPDGELMGTVLAAVAQRESRQLGRRISLAQRSREERGLVSNSFVPIGWQKKTKLDGDKVLRYFAPCEAERWWIRIFRHLYNDDVFTQRTFKRWVARSEYIRRGHRGSRGKWSWAAYRLSGEIFRRGFPPNQLITRLQTYRKDRVDAEVFHARPRSARAVHVKPKLVAGDWLLKVKTDSQKRRDAQLRRQQCPEPDERRAWEDDLERCSLSDPGNSTPSP